ncbi:MAG: HAD family hydrolase [Bacteroidales bacterium]|nr:HAD family hydrolase [Bacteroidales bacterium]MCB9013408.1 HAD family hydrolase [Bacteroidales bacterium]
MEKNSALFLDRDGTIIEDRGYLKKADEIVFIPGCFEALRKLQNFFKFFIITNQSGISKGILTEEEVKNVNESLLQKLKAEEILINEIYVCPHRTEDNCHCKKPSPFFINQAKSDYQLNLQSSFILGDHPSDVECGLNAGVKPVYLLSGHGMKHLREVSPGTLVMENIVEAADYILKNLYTKH